MTDEAKHSDTLGKATPSEHDVIDVAVIGAGPAGLTAGLYATRAGFNAVLFERIAPGGQLAQTEFLENYPGFVEGTGGFELAYSMKQQADRFGVVHKSEEVTSVDFTQEPKVLTTPFGTYYARSVIIATGSRPRKLGLAHEDDLQGRGVSYCATCDGNFFRDKTVMVVGGGNTAVGDAIYLARICKKVYLMHRRDQLRATAIYHKTLEALENLEFLWKAVPHQLLFDDTGLVGIEAEMLETGEVKRIDLDGLFVAVGTEPNTEFLKGALTLDKTGYIVADSSGETEVPGVYAAGDVRTKFLYQVVTAVADGAECAERAAEYLAM